jgi:hypothetical protein
VHNCARHRRSDRLGTSTSIRLSTRSATASRDARIADRSSK